MGLRHKSVLLASRDHDTLQGLAQALTLDGYAVTTALNWSEVMLRLHRVPLSVILYDVMGLDDAERERLAIVRRAHPEISIVLLSSLESSELSRAVEEGLIAGYLVKPLRLPSLEECLNRLGAGGRAAGD